VWTTFPDDGRDGLVVNRFGLAEAANYAVDICSRAILVSVA
jgi:hypothetical protein